MPVCCEFCVSSGRGLCYGLIARPEETYGMCVCVCVCVCLAECKREASIMGSSRPTAVSLLASSSARAQKSSSRPLTAEAPVRSQARLCGICGEPSGTETSLPPRTSFLPCQYRCTVAPLLIRPSIAVARKTSCIGLVLLLVR
jgi:hypothetical protein